MSGIPAGQTWFSTLKKSFVDVPITADGIATDEFLEAASATTTLFGTLARAQSTVFTGIANNFSVDLLGSVAFTPVKKDMTGNIAKVRDRQLAAPAEAQTLQSLVKGELATKKHTATEGLLWLVRGLDFTAQALRADLSSNSGVSLAEAKPPKELADSFRAAYKTTLAPHHSFMVKPIFSAAMSATPYRKDFTAKLVGEGVAEDDLKSEIEKWVSALEERIGILKTFLASPEGKW